MVQKILFMLIRTHDDVIRSLNEKEKIKQNNFGISFFFEKKGFFEPKQLNVPILLQLFVEYFTYLMNFLFSRMAREKSRPLHPTQLLLKRKKNSLGHKSNNFFCDTIYNI